jgi:hypothetical protein
MFEAENQITPLLQKNDKRTENRLNIHRCMNKPQPLRMLHQASRERYLKFNANTNHAPSSTPPDLCTFIHKRDNCTKLSRFMNLLFGKGTLAPNFLVKEMTDMISGRNRHILKRKKERHKIQSK